VFTRPHDLSDERIGAELAAGWDFAAPSLSYLPVGFGSHHWLATDPAGRQLFLIVHDLPAMLRSQLDTVDAAYGRLRAAFECAVSLHRDENLEFVVAPVPAAGGMVVRRLSQRYSMAVCPYLADSEPGHAGAFTAEDRHAAGVTALMTAYSELADDVSSRPERFVVTHGEPGPWNVVKTPAGLVIVDWDFVQLAPPERDLWELAEADRSLLAAYTSATGTVIDNGALALFRMWYDLSEIAGYIELFRGAHDDTDDSAESWKNLEYFLRPAERWPQLQLLALGAADLERQENVGEAPEQREEPDPDQK
jgi:Phosphotransferase enzyme family